MSHDAKRIIGAVLLAFVTVLVFVSLVSYDPADPPGDATPVNSPVLNWAGIVGAHIAYWLLTIFGIVSYLMVGLGMLWVVLLLSKRRFPRSWVQGIGAILFIAGVCGLFYKDFCVLPPWEDIPGYGGLMGVVLGSRLVQYLAVPGALVLLVTLSIVGLVAATDMLLVDAGRRLGAAVIRKLVTSRESTRSRRGGLAVGRLKPAAPPDAVAAPVAPLPDDLFDLGRIEAEESQPRPAPGDETPEAAGADEPAAEDFGFATASTAAEKSESTKPRRRKRKEPSATDVAVAEVPQEDTYSLPSSDLLDEGEQVDQRQLGALLNEKARRLAQALTEFGVEGQVVNAETGPVITQFEVELGPGVRVQKVIGLNNDISMALEAPVRIVAPIPGKSTVGIEVPNPRKRWVRLKEVMAEVDRADKMKVPLFLGKDIYGNCLVQDLAEMPHLLVAGQTGSGKSICLNAIICSILMTRSPSDVKLLLVDPKMVELSIFKEIPHLMCPVVTDMRRAAGILEWMTEKMDQRYELLLRARVRHITSYNKLSREEIIDRLQLTTESDIARTPFKLHYIVMIIDEFADLMMQARKEVETSVCRLAAKSRSVGVHLVFATQRPSMDVVTGLIRSNLPCRIAFQVASKVDSRIILDRNGAETLLGKGDMLFLPPGTAKLVRAQGSFVSEEEVRRITDYVRSIAAPSYSRELMQLRGSGRIKGLDKEPLYEDAVRLVLQTKRGSVSLVQQRLQVGYQRASRILDMMYEDGIVGEYKGSQAREVLITEEEWAERSGISDADDDYIQDEQDEDYEE